MILRENRIIDLELLASGPGAGPVENKLLYRFRVIRSELVITLAQIGERAPSEPG